MSVFKCKMCGGTIEFEPGASVGVCDSCGTKQTLPRLDDDRRANLYDRANHFRRNNEFDKAAGMYEQILTEDRTDAEAYWSLVLCRYGIEYVEDPATKKRVPTVNRAQFTSVFDDDNYQSALRYADGYQRELYEKEAKAINDIQKGILAISQKEEPFDVFICYKETDANGRRTPDSVLANDLYHQLTQEGFKVFFSRITLEDKLGTAYEPYIFAALNSAKVMVALGTKPEYFNAVWVKNEWSRYLALVKQSGGKKILIPAYKDMDPYDLPEEFSHLQAQDMSKLGFMQDLIRGIKKIVKADEPKPAAVKETVTVQNESGNLTAILDRGFLALEDGEWTKADSFFEQALNFDAKNARAYLGKLMAELHVKTQDGLKDCEQPFDGSNNYQKAVRFGDGPLKKELERDIAYINERNENARLNGIYDSVVQTMRAATTEKEFKKAADAFQTIPGFKDADELIDACNERIADIRAEKERRAAQKKAEAEKRKKRNKKIAAITLPSVAACIAFVILLTTVIIPKQKFNKAMKLIDSGDYESAYALLEELGNNETIVANKYDRAMVLIDAGDYESAYALLEELGNNEAIVANKYDRAMVLIDAGDYEAAHALLEELGNSEAIASNKYDRAMALINSGDYEAAYTLLNGLNYKDSDNILSSIPQLKKILLSKAEVGSYVYFGSYEQDNNTANEKEDIEWLVLAKEGNKALVISKYALDCQQYNTSFTDVTWETCSLRKWLNGTFLNAAFSESEKAMIHSVTVSADKNPYDSTNPGNNTTDQIFLLSITEASKYFSSDSARKCQGTVYCYAQGAHKAFNESCWWWLRSSSYDSHFASHVNHDGSVIPLGYYVDYDGGAVRPALWIDLGS